jgi:hypothetical protein
MRRRKGRGNKKKIRKRTIVLSRSLALELLSVEMMPSCFRKGT